MQNAPHHELQHGNEFGAPLACQAHNNAFAKLTAPVRPISCSMAINSASRKLLRWPAASNSDRYCDIMPLQSAWGVETREVSQKHAAAQAARSIRHLQVLRRHCIPSG